MTLSTNADTIASAVVSTHWEEYLVTLKGSLLVSSLVLLAPTLALSTTVSINNQCQTPNCFSPDTLNAGGSTGSSLYTIYTFANGDQYFVSGTYGASYDAANGVNISVNPAAQYIGNIANKNAPSQADILTFNFYQNYNFTTGSADGYYMYYAISDTSGPIASNSSYTVNLDWDGQQIGASVWGVGYSGTNLFNQKLYSGLVTDPLAADYFISMFFGAGSDPGAAFTTITPEPSSILLLAIGGLGLLGVAFKGARRKIAAPVRS